MNNTRNILLVAIITATLVLGTSVIPMQSYADKDDDEDKKTTKDHSSPEDKKDAKLNLDQGNTCYRGDVCKQGNEGQQVVGNDNDVTGFNDQSDNLPSNLPGTGIDNGNETGSPITPPSQVDGSCLSGEVRVSGTVGAGIQFNGCISSSLVGLLQSLPTPIGGECTGSLVSATIAIGTGNPTTVCVGSNIRV
jgi:hypothetical protein